MAMDKSDHNGSSENEKEIASKVGSEASLWKFWQTRRYLLGFLAFFGFFNVYALRVNLSIAIVAMTENKTITLENGTQVFEPEFDWDTKIQGYVLSSFFYGYITTQMLGGWLAGRFGGNHIFGAGIAITALLTLVTPLLAKTDVYLLIAVRVVEGVFEGVTYPCIHAIWSKWAPPLERSRLATLAFSGAYMGTVVAMPVCGVLASNIGWESIFYVFGTLGLIWYALWLYHVRDCPAKDPRISKEEREYIETSLGNVGNKIVKHPVKDILTSIPVWAIVISHFSENWGFYTLLTQLPKFMNDTLDFDLTKTGFMAAVPYLVMSIVMQFSGYVADKLQIKNILTTTQVRKVFTCFAFVAQTVFMLGAAFWLSPVGSMTSLTLAVGLGALAWSGFGVNYLDIAPQHAGVILGLGNTFATIPGIVSPILSGYIVTNKTAEEWKVVFYITSAIYLVGAIVFGTFGSGELQPWAKDPDSKLPEENEKAKESIKRIKPQGHDNLTFQSDK